MRLDICSTTSSVPCNRSNYLEGATTRRQSDSRLTWLTFQASLPSTLPPAQTGLVDRPLFSDDTRTLRAFSCAGNPVL
jgi:hypothetical protein